MDGKKRHSMREIQIEYLLFVYLAKNVKFQTMTQIEMGADAIDMCPGRSIC